LILGLSKSFYINFFISYILSAIK